MSKKDTAPTKILASINANLFQVRLTSERATLTPALPNKAPQQVQLRTDTSSDFSIGLDSDDKPRILTITVNYKATLKTLDTEKQIVDYEANHEALFNLIGWAGFDDWTDMPPEAISPYLALMHNIALRKAEGTLFEMGVKGASLPRPEHFNGNESPASADDAVSVG